MTIFEEVRCGARPDAVKIGADFVSVNTDIREETVTCDGETYTEFVYRQTRYGKDEYISLLDEQLTDAQLALCDLYEMLGG